MMEGFDKKAHPQMSFPIYPVDMWNAIPNFYDKYFEARY